MAAARGRRRVPRRAVAARRCAATSGGTRHGGPSASRAAVRRRPPPRRPVRPLRAAPPGDGPRVGGRRRRRRRRRALPTDVAWQAELWRRLRERIAHARPGRAARRARARGCATTRRSSTSRSASSLFGLTRLPAGHLERAARARRRTATSTCSCSTRRPALWERVAGATGPTGRSSGARRPDRDAARQPPARLLGPRRARAAARARRRRRARRPPPPASSTARGHAARAASRPTSAPTAAARRAAAGRADERPVLDPDDRSVQVHACHGRARQVEVLRDAILHLLADDPTLEPRDVIVMCPDIETFAPLIQATFGAGEVAGTTTSSTRCRPTCARPTCGSGSPTARCARPTRSSASSRGCSTLAERAAHRIAGARLRRPRAGAPPLPPRRRRPRAASRSGSRASGIRWGLDAAHRAPVQARRAARGHVARRPRPRARRRDDDRGRAAAVRRRAPARRRRQRRHRPRRALRRARRPPARGARRARRAAADRRVGGGDRRRRRRARRRRPQRDAWQRAELQRLLDDVVAEATVDGPRPTPLALPEVRALLADRLQGRPTRANFRTGHLTICTLVPMRSVPHRVVCLLGLDDGVFPRKAPRDGDDLMLDDPHVGDRDARTEDRQLLLDALLAATDRLVVTYTGNDERTNARAAAGRAGRRAARRGRPRRSATAGGGPRASGSSCATRCSRSTPATSRAGALVPGRPWSFDRVTLDGARALTGRARRARAVPRRPAAGRRGARWSSSTTSCASSSTRCGRSCASGSGSASATSPTRSTTRCRSSSTGSRQWGVGQRLLDARLAGADGRGGGRARRSRAARCRRACSPSRVIDARAADRRARSSRTAGPCSADRRPGRRST